MDVEQKVNLLDFDRDGLGAFFTDMGEKAFRASQILKWVYHQRVTEFQGMTNLGQGLRERLAEKAEFRFPEIVSEHCASDGTIKWMMGMDTVNNIETVYIPEENRGTLCISSQVGCALDCRFCSTAQQGFNRNLSVGEIVGQIWQATGRLPEGHKITNIVLMGMGEPLLNFANVVTAMNIMKDDLAFGLARKRITLSTSGVVPALDRLREVSDISLAVSLHAPTDKLRDELVPINKKYPIKELLAACKRYISREARAKVTFEYVMLKDVNDQPEHARALVKLLANVPSKLNLIPFNPFPGANYECSSPEVIERFRQELIKGGLFAFTRKTRGDDIDAACGQLVGKFRDRSRRQERLLKVEVS